MVTTNRYIKSLLHPAGGHQGSHKAHQAGNLDVIFIEIGSCCFGVVKVNFRLIWLRKYYCKYEFSYIRM